MTFRKNFSLIIIFEIIAQDSSSTEDIFTTSLSNTMNIWNFLVTIKKTFYESKNN